jgi:hypothetical protein
MHVSSVLFIAVTVYNASAGDSLLLDMTLLFDYWCCRYQTCTEGGF